MTALSDCGSRKASNFTEACNVCMLFHKRSAYSTCAHAQAASHVNLLQCYEMQLSSHLSAGTTAPGTLTVCGDASLSLSSCHFSRLLQLAQENALLDPPLLSVNGMYLYWNLLYNICKTTYEHTSV